MGTLEIPSFEDRGLWNNPFVIGEGWRHYRVGTCTGAYRATKEAYEILAITNDKPGNGHVEAALAWFYKSCKAQKRVLIVKEVMEKKLEQKLIKYGFTCKSGNDYIKRF
jgi:hypothetical protein